MQLPKIPLRGEPELFPVRLKIIDTVTQPLRDIDDSVPCISRRIALEIDYLPSLDGTGRLLVAFLEKAVPIN